MFFNKMAEEVKENCGIIALATREPSADVVPLSHMLLKKLQHRGQDGAGFSFFNKEIETFKELGSVDEVFKKLKLGDLKQQFTRAIGHVRYTTSGKNDYKRLQPEERAHDRLWKWFSFCFNGNIANVGSLRREIEEIGEKYEYKNVESDTEVIKVLLSRENKGDFKPPMREVFESVSKKLDGSYSLAYLNACGELVVARDPRGFLPLFYAHNSEVFAAASENSALSMIFPKEEIVELKPGEMIVVDKCFNVSKYQFAESEKKSYCMFQYVYFMSPASSFNKAQIANVRRELGRRLALSDFLRNKDKQDFVVVPVPDSAFSSAYSYAETLGIPIVEGLKKNELAGRNFIMASQSIRESAIKLKHDVISAVLDKKHVILIDDSLVRGTTSINRVEQLKKAGALSVHLRFTCPPIVSPCFYGIDFPSKKELFASKHAGLSLDDVEERIAKEAGADSVHYQNINDFTRAICSVSGEFIKKEDLCLACLTGEYPTDAGRENASNAL